MALDVAIGIAWLMLSAAIMHHKLTHLTPDRQKLMDEFRARSSTFPWWVVPIAIAIILPFGPFIAAHGWLERRQRKPTDRG